MREGLQLNRSAASATFLLRLPPTTADHKKVQNIAGRMSLVLGSQYLLNEARLLEVWKWIGLIHPPCHLSTKAALTLLTVDPHELDSLDID